MKALFYFVCALFGLTACRSHEQAQAEANVKLVTSMFEAFNRHEWKAMANHYADTAAFLDPSFGLDYVHQHWDEVARKYGEMEKAFPNIHDEVVGVYPSGDKVTVEFVSTGTGLDGTQFKLPISCTLTVADGKIVKDATYYDL